MPPSIRSSCRTLLAAISAAVVVGGCVHAPTDDAAMADAASSTPAADSATGNKSGEKATSAPAGRSSETSDPIATKPDTPALGATVSASHIAVPASPADGADAGRMSDDRRGLGLVLPPSAPFSSIDGRSRQWDVPDIPKNLKQDPYRASDQQGLASWYGGQFHGRKTANGERFDKEGFTAAHKTLPFGTQICVRSMVTGKTVMVRVNDRGPYSGDRIIDLSQGAAQELGMLGLGIKPVEFWILGEDEDDCPSFVLAGRRNAGKLVAPGKKAALGKDKATGRVRAVVPAKVAAKSKARVPAPKKRR
ncbi:MAG: septal ring lytic transglycosylase RlpA family protein [Comamonas sp.]